MWPDRVSNRGFSLRIWLFFSIFIFHLQPNGEAQEIMSVRQGPVRLFRVLPSPDTGILI